MFVSYLSRGAILALVGLALSPAAACEQPDQSDCPTVSLEAGYTGEAWRNAAGGLDSGSAYLDMLDLKADLDAGKLGVQGLQIHAHVQYNNGHEFGARYVGERQTLSNIEGVPTWRLYELWADYQFGVRGQPSVRFGLYDFNTEFNALESSALFINSSHGIGPDVSQSGLNGPSIFPVPGLALRVRGGNEKFYWLAAALDAVPGQPRHPDRTGIHLDGDEGALLALEAGRVIGGFSKLSLGVWRYTAEFDSVDEFDINGDSLRARGNQGWYLLAERPLWSREQAKLTAFLRAGAAETRFNPLSSFIGAGAVWSGLGARRPNDELGIAIAVANNSARYRALTSLAGAPLKARETVLEMTWRTPLNDWLTLQPDIQYVIDPGMDPGLTNAWAFGLRFQVSTSWSR